MVFVVVAAGAHEVSPHTQCLRSLTLPLRKQHPFLCISCTQGRLQLAFHVTVPSGLQGAVSGEAGNFCGQSHGGESLSPLGGHSGHSRDRPQGLFTGKSHESPGLPLWDLGRNSQSLRSFEAPLGGTGKEEMVVLFIPFQLSLSYDYIL